MKRRDRSEPLLRLALAVCAGAGWLASAVVILEHLEPRSAWPLAIACLAWLVFSPLCEAAATRAVRRVPIVGERLAWGVWVAEVLPIFLLPVPIADALIFGSMILAQGHLFLASDDDRNAARCLAAAPLLAVIALAYTPSAVVLLLVPLSATASLVALVLLHGRAARRRLARGRPPAEEARALRGRLVYAAPLALASLTAALAVFLSVERAIVASRGGAPDARAAQQPLRPPREALGAGGGGRSGPAEGYSADLPFSGGTLPFSDEPVMKVRPLDEESATRLGRAVHMRDMVLDTFYEGGVRARDVLPGVHSDSADGRRDGWTWVARPRETGELLGYEVLVRALTAQGMTLAFSPHPLAATTLPRVRYDPDHLFAIPEERNGWFPYRVAVVARDLSPRELRRRAARHPDSRYLQLPPAGAALDAVRAAADAVVPDGDDFDRVQAVVRFFLTDFTYDLESLEFEGTTALARFLTERRGYCTHFASTAALMLRARGIPARVATGFLAHEWSDEERAWIVRERDAHAWLEVHFESAGWVTFDPTARAGDRGSFDPYGDDGLAGWTQRLSDELERWIGSSGREGSLGAVLWALAVVPLGHLARHPAAWAIASAALFLALHWMRERRRPRHAGPAPPASMPRPVADLFQRLARALASRGYRREPGQTPREFARRVSAVAGAPLAPLVEVTEWYYRARFGERPLSAGELAAVERLVEVTESPARAPTPPP